MDFSIKSLRPHGQKIALYIVYASLNSRRVKIKLDTMLAHTPQLLNYIGGILHNMSITTQNDFGIMQKNLYFRICYDGEFEKYNFLYKDYSRIAENCFPEVKKLIDDYFAKSA